MARYNDGSAKILWAGGLSIAALIAAACFAMGTTRVKYGNVGLYETYSGEIESKIIPAGSLHQDIIGRVHIVPVRDVPLPINNIYARDADSAQLDDLDILLVYSVNEQFVDDLYRTKSRAFHKIEGDEVILMYNYLERLLRDAAQNTIKKYNAQFLNTSKETVRNEILKEFETLLRAEKLDQVIRVSAFNIISLMPNKELLDKATQLKREQLNLQIKDAQNQNAVKDAERNRIMSDPKAISLMDAETRRMWAQAALAGKVKAVVISSELNNAQIKVTE